MPNALLLDIRKTDPDGFIEKTLQPIIENLNGFDELQLFVHAEEISIDQDPLEEREKSETQWKRKIGEWSGDKGFHVEVFYDRYGTPTGPCEDWFKNMWFAFSRNKDLQSVIYLPYDITYFSDPQEALNALQGFIDEFNGSVPDRPAYDLFLGTYEIVTLANNIKDQTSIFLVPVDVAAASTTKERADIRKNFLESFTVTELWTLFPKTMEWYCEQRSHPDHPLTPRTGFFGLSRELFRTFYESHRRTMAPWAGTVQLFLCAALLTRLKQGEEFKIGERFIGRLVGPAEGFDGYGFRHQRERIAYVIADERHYWAGLIRDAQIPEEGKSVRLSEAVDV